MAVSAETRATISSTSESRTSRKNDFMVGTYSARAPISGPMGANDANIMIIYTIGTIPAIVLISLSLQAINASRLLRAQYLEYQSWAQPDSAANPAQAGSRRGLCLPVRLS